MVSEIKKSSENSMSTPVKKGVHCEIKIKIFTENGCDTVQANVM